MLLSVMTYFPPSFPSPEVSILKVVILNPTASFIFLFFFKLKCSNWLKRGKVILSSFVPFSYQELS